MKKFSKVILILCLVLVCVGVVCIGAGAAMGSSLEEVMRMADEGELNFRGFNICKGLFYLDDLDDIEVLEDKEVLKGVVEQSFHAKETLLCMQGRGKHSDTGRNNHTSRGKQ